MSGLERTTKWHEQKPEGVTKKGTIKKYYRISISSVNMRLKREDQTL